MHLRVHRHMKCSRRGVPGRIADSRLPLTTHSLLTTASSPRYSFPAQGPSKNYGDWPGAVLFASDQVAIICLLLAGTGLPAPLRWDHLGRPVIGQARKSTASMSKP